MPQAPETVYLADYRPAPWTIDAVDLRIELDEPVCRVTASLTLRALGRKPAPLRLHGEKLTLESLQINGSPADPDQYAVDAGGMVITGLPTQAELRIVTLIRPDDNTELEGLYRSNGIYCTQCEAEGFRRITYFLDRPDVLARYSTTIVADPARCPVLLSNGNRVEAGQLDDGRHWCRWVDPHPKPSYLFALVAGELASLERLFTTASGREVTLRLYAEARNIDRCDHAMNALVEAMRWDERAYGREYDLDVYMIVAVDDFNMGAMENKGLNVFNSKYVLASPEMATDDDYAGIAAVIGHEYFHNWTGNRITCRDWFQLSLKEGLTVFREQQFCADRESPGVQRIRDVRRLRATQFPEDAGGTAHAVRPASYIEINNLYTATVYEKGAELISMLHGLLGATAFRAGMDRYFAEHDGQAVTVEDFLACMEAASGENLRQFKRWYLQSGTPQVTVQRDYDPDAGRLTLTLGQFSPPTPGQGEKLPLHVPVRIKCLDSAGRPLPMALDGGAARDEHLLELREARGSWQFSGLTDRPVLSLLRGFSAPVELVSDASRGDRLTLLAHDDDAFARWDAAQQLALELIGQHLDAESQGRSFLLDSDYISACDQLLATALEAGADLALVAELFALPEQRYVMERQDPVDAQAVAKAVERVAQTRARALEERLAAVHAHCRSRDEPGARRLGNLALAALVGLGKPRWRKLALAQFNEADNMTDTIGALGPLSRLDCPERGPALQAFYERWQQQPLIVDKWLALHAQAPLGLTCAVVGRLLEHPAFQIRNPNRVRALIGSFAMDNPRCFHAADGAGYALVAEQILRLNDINPQVAARLAGAFNRWRKFVQPQRQAQRDVLRQLLAAPALARDVYEVVAKSLGADEAADAA